MNDPRIRPLDVPDLSDDQLGALLRQAFEFPATPDLVSGVAAILEAKGSGRGRRWSWPRLSRGVALALLGIFIAGAVVVAAILGVPGIRILTIERVDRPSPAITAPESSVQPSSIEAVPAGASPVTSGPSVTGPSVGQDPRSLLRHPSAEVRLRAVTSIGSAVPPAEATRLLSDVLRSDPDSRVRAAAATALTGLFGRSDTA